MAEGVNFEARLPRVLVRDGDDVEVVLFEKEAAIDILPVPRKLLLYDELGHVVHDLRAELVDLEKINDRQRVASVLPIYQGL